MYPDLTLDLFLRKMSTPVGGLCLCYFSCLQIAELTLMITFFNHALLRKTPSLLATNWTTFVWHSIASFVQRLLSTLVNTCCWLASCWMCCRETRVDLLPRLYCRQHWWPIQWIWWTNIVYNIRHVAGFILDKFYFYSYFKTNFYLSMLLYHN